MLSLNRRTFVQLSSAAALGVASRQVSGLADTPSISSQAGVIRVTGSNYSWEYAQTDDTFRLRDAKNRVVVSGGMQPAVVVAPADQPALRLCIPGKAGAPRSEGGRVTVPYEGVNGAGRLSVTWRFDEFGIWTEPIVYEAPADQDVVSLHYFAGVKDGKPAPSLHASYLVIPGISEASISPIVRDEDNFNESVSLGRGGSATGFGQQWGLPVHYFCGFNTGGARMRNSLTEGKSAAFTCGLADLPGGDFYLQLDSAYSSVWVDYRSDLWKHMRGPGSIPLGATLYWSIAPDYYEAIAGYYQGLLHAGVIHKSQPSAKKIAAALAPQFCTWGSQVDRQKDDRLMDEAYLAGIYEELKASGMKAGMFSIDEKWEGKHGKLEHDAARLPHFEQFLDRVRSEGYKIGVWAALMRCEDPADMGLTADQMLKKPNGEPFEIVGYMSKYYIMDFTRPEVAKVLEDVARKFIRRYKVDLLKFDFGYEMPSLAGAAPYDKKFTGERLMRKGLDVLINAMRKENPDLVVMYYSLSPLFLDYFDLFSPDDLALQAGDYDVEANRRFFFSSLLGQLGVPTYGSSGYDWACMPNIWFDSAAVGTLGSMNDFRADEQGERDTPEFVAKYNGLTHVLRPTVNFEILPLDWIPEAATLGAHARSWARFEAGQLVLLAYRPPVPGDYRLLARQTDDPRVKGSVQSSVPVVVASKTGDSIASGSKLSMVPYGDGEIVLRRNFGSKAEIISHYFGEAETNDQATIENGKLSVTARTRNQAGMPLEWIEVHIS